MVGNVVFFPASRTKFRSTHPLDSIDIALGHSGVAAETPITVSEMINGTVGKIPNGVALSYKLGDRWSSITYQQYYDLCISAAKSFIKVDIQQILHRGLSLPLPHMLCYIILTTLSRAC